MEVWRDIKGYENLYQISSEGRVKSLGNGKSNVSKERVLKPYKTKDGYLHIDLFNENGRKVFNVHRLVAQAFIDNPNNFPEINHKNENKTNNRVENLEWCNRKYNCNYGTHNERMAKSKSMPVLQFSKTDEFIKKWDSAIQVKKELGIDNGAISKCCKGKLKTIGRFKWGYLEDYEKIKFNVFDLEIYRKRVA